MFSELVDSIMLRSGRLDARATIVDYLNMTMKEVQNKGFFHRDLVEDLLTAGGSPFVWERPPHFRKMRSVYYPAAGDYPTFMPPGRKQSREDFYYYAGPNYFVFAGVSPAETVCVAYYTRFPGLHYYPSGERPATYDSLTGEWTYADGIETDEAKELARNRVSNWTLHDYKEVLIEGTLAKAWKLFGDTDRASMAYSLFQQRLKDEVLVNEMRETEGL